MAVKQVSIFLPNQQGTLANVMDILTENNIEIHALVAIDTPEMGILRIIAEDAEKAQDLFREAGMVAKTTNVIMFEPGEKQESLGRLFNLLKKSGVNIEYTYTCFMQEEGLPFMVLKADKEKEALEILSQTGLRVVNL